MQSYSPASISLNVRYSAQELNLSKTTSRLGSQLWFNMDPNRYTPLPKVTTLGILTFVEVAFYVS